MMLPMYIDILEIPANSYKHHIWKEEVITSDHPDPTEQLNACHCYFGSSAGVSRP
eukprot:m.170354 g.170354  ORF g.170354 m.170354 type:complete len:55 (+) comp39038_c0_seq1:353-517(+)